MNTVLVVEDHALVRQSLVKIVSEGAFRVVGEVGDADAALEQVRQHQPDIVLLDIGLPGEDGLQLAGRIRSAAPATRIVFVTMHEDDATIRGAVAVGADGYVPKSASTEEFVNALRIVAGGESYLSPSIARRVMAMAGGRHTGPASRLTNRELEILRLIAQGHPAGDVAKRLFVSVKTVKNHLTSIYAKLGVRSGAQAVAKAYQEGLAV